MIGKRKTVEWVGSSLKDLKDFPDEIRETFGYGIFLAQVGDRHPDAKPLKGFGGAHVLELVEDHDGDTYRGVYTVRFEEAVYVLHCFQKKSKRGVSTPQHDIDLIRKRLKAAEEHYKRWKTETG
jgi:phage-related protein